MTVYGRSVAPARARRRPGRVAELARADRNKVEWYGSDRRVYRDGEMLEVLGATIPVSELFEPLKPKSE
jgi:hypothetical protein